jgi:GT2 family glycosyltransferase
MVTVVDNGSTDGSIGAIATRHPKARLLPLGTNQGFTGGIAAGIARSPARNVIFLNNDATPEPGWLASLTRAIDDAPADVIAVGGKIVDTTGTLIDFIGGVVTFDGHAFQTGFRFPLGSRREPAAGEELLFACGGNMIARREAFAALGGFDDDYFAYLEDVDFGWRSWIAGNRTLYEPAALVRHVSAGTSGKLGDFERGVLFERNALQTVLKNFENATLHDVAGSVFVTYLHRLHHYATERNVDASELTRAPIDVSHRKRPSLRARLARRLRRRKPLATIDDPLTAMQFRAFEWVIEHGERIAAKREAVQKIRKRSDREILERFPLHVVPTYPGDDELMKSALFRILRPSVPLVERPLSEIIRR